MICSGLNQVKLNARKADTAFWVAASNGSLSFRTHLYISTSILHFPGVRTCQEKQEGAGWPLMGLSKPKRPSSSGTLWLLAENGYSLNKGTQLPWPLGQALFP